MKGWSRPGSFLLHSCKCCFALSRKHRVLGGQLFRYTFIFRSLGMCGLKNRSEPTEVESKPRDTVTTITFTTILIVIQLQIRLALLGSSTEQGGRSSRSILV
jgi:hypothetical protein